VGDRAFAVFASCAGRGLEFAGQCTSFTLYSSSASADNWAPVGGPTSGLKPGPGRSVSLVLTGSRGYLIGPDGTLYAGPVDGGAAWQRAGPLPSSCQVGPAQLDGQPSGALLAAVNASRLILACTSATPGARQNKLIFSSADAGASWQALPAAPEAGVAYSLAASPAGTVVLGTDRGIEVLPEGAPAWQTAIAAGSGRAPARGFGYVGMTTSTQGVALPADPASGTVWFTYDGGQSWRPSGVS
jgi:photosystem II stability/assembly factor-like uncharacterized protein